MDPYIIKAFQYEELKMKSLFRVLDEAYSKVINDLKHQVGIVESSLDEVDQADIS